MGKIRVAIIVLVISLLAGCVSSPDKTTEKASSYVSDLLADHDISGEITVSCYDSSGTKPFLEEAARLFEMKYRNTKINVVSFSALPEVKTIEVDGEVFTVSSGGNDPQAIQDYITKTNVEIMSGKAADVFALDVLPFYKYIATGDFEDLREYMIEDKDFNLSDYHTSLFDALAINGVQGVIPIDYSFSYVSYDSTLFSDEEQALLDKMGGASFEELIEFGKDAFLRINEASAEPVYMFDIYANEGMLFSLLKQNYSTFLDVLNRSANFTDGQFTSMLESVIDYGESGYLPLSRDDAQGGSNRVMYKENPGFLLARNFITDPYGLSMIGVMSSKIDTDDKVIGVLKNARGETSFDLGKSVAINANSPNKRLAWEYVKFLLSYEMQTSPWVFGFPLHKEAFADQTRLLLTGQLWEMEDARSGLDEKGEQELANYLHAVNELTSQINTYFIKDFIVNDMVNSEIYHFYNNDKTAQEVSSAIQNKLYLYLNE